MSIRDEATITAPLNSLCPMCRDMALRFSRYLAEEDKREAERRLMQDTVTTPEKIKNAWARYGSSARDHFEHGEYLRLQWLPPIKSPCRFEDCTSMEAVYEVFDFKRTITPTYKAGPEGERLLDFTVTRISCMGITVEETIS